MIGEIVLPRVCECGCGEQTAASTRTQGGYKRGEYVRFVPGHHIQKGAKSLTWKGGRGLTTQGYIWVMSPDHPNSYDNGRVYEHRLIMEQHIGRYLEPEEVVHHENEDKIDNRIENLRLFVSQAEHQAYHRAG